MLCLLHIMPWENSSFFSSQHAMRFKMSNKKAEERESPTTQQIKLLSWSRPFRHIMVMMVIFIVIYKAAVRQLAKTNVIISKKPSPHTNCSWLPFHTINSFVLKFFYSFCWLINEWWSRHDVEKNFKAASTYLTDKYL